MYCVPKTSWLLHTIALGLEVEILTWIQTQIAIMSLSACFQFAKINFRLVFWDISAVTVNLLYSLETS